MSHFSFLHSYETTGRYYDAIERAGLVRPFTGIRLVNTMWGDDTHRFNHTAAKNGALFRRLAREKRQLVIDRLCGGAQFLAGYTYDRELMAEYAALLGPRFLGFQIHETACNTDNDWQRFLAFSPEYRHRPVDLDLGADHRPARRAHPHGNGPILHGQRAQVRRAADVGG